MSRSSIDEFEMDQKGSLSKDEIKRIKEVLPAECTKVNLGVLSELVDAGLTLDSGIRNAQAVGTILLCRAAGLGDKKVNIEGEDVNVGVEIFKSLLEGKAQGVLGTYQSGKNVLHYAGQKGPEALADIASCLKTNDAAKLLFQKNGTGEEPLLESYRANKGNSEGLNTLKDFVVSMLKRDELKDEFVPRLDEILVKVCNKLGVEKPKIISTVGADVYPESREADVPYAVGGGRVESPVSDRTKSLEDIEIASDGSRSPISDREATPSPNPREGGAAAPDAPRPDMSDRRTRVALGLKSSGSSDRSSSLESGAEVSAHDAPKVPNVSKIVGSMRSTFTDHNPDRVSFKPAPVRGSAKGSAKGSDGMGRG